MNLKVQTTPRLIIPEGKQKRKLGLTDPEVVCKEARVGRTGEKSSNSSVTFPELETGKARRLFL